jgi:hypothetical protein
VLFQDLGLNLAVNRVPFRAEMFRIPAAEVLRRAHILWRLESSEEVIVLGAIEWALAVHRSFTNHARLMDIEILESVVRHTVREEIAVAMAVGAASATRQDFLAKKIFAACNLGCLGGGWNLPKRVRKESGLVPRPKNLQISYVNSRPCRLCHQVDLPIAAELASVLSRPILHALRNGPFDPPAENRNRGPLTT